LGLDVFTAVKTSIVVLWVGTEVTQELWQASTGPNGVTSQKKVQLKTALKGCS
jgi:hypothetical protein